MRIKKDPHQEGSPGQENVCPSRPKAQILKSHLCAMFARGGAHTTRLFDGKSDSATHCLTHFPGCHANALAHGYLETKVRLAIPFLE